MDKFISLIVTLLILIGMVVLFTTDSFLALGCSVVICFVIALLYEAGNIRAYSKHKDEE